MAPLAHSVQHVRKSDPMACVRDGIGLIVSSGIGGQLDAGTNLWGSV